jgi:hypothetical protein
MHCLGFDELERPGFGLLVLDDAPLVEAAGAGEPAHPVATSTGAGDARKPAALAGFRAALLGTPTRTDVAAA